MQSMQSLRREGHFHHATMGQEEAFSGQDQGKAVFRRGESLTFKGGCLYAPVQPKQLRPGRNHWFLPGQSCHPPSDVCEEEAPHRLSGAVLTG